MLQTPKANNKLLYVILSMVFALVLLLSDQGVTQIMKKMDSTLSDQHEMGKDLTSHASRIASIETGQIDILRRLTSIESKLDYLVLREDKRQKSENLNRGAFNYDNKKDGIR